MSSLISFPIKHELSLYVKKKNGANTKVTKKYSKNLHSVSSEVAHTHIKYIKT